MLNVVGARLLGMLTEDANGIKAIVRWDTRID
jgi:hypothetical protein